MTTIAYVTETIMRIAYYLVITYAIYSAKTVIIAFINRRTELMDMFVPRTPAEVGVDQARRHGVFDFETNGDEVH